jgi:hypothetical protein
MHRTLTTVATKLNEEKDLKKFGISKQEIYLTFYVI